MIARDLLDRPALAQRGEDREQPLPVGRRQALAQLHRVGHPLLARAIEPSSSSEAIPFISASRKVPPIAITSPTDFIEVPSVGGAPGNFSNAQRGILTTV